MPKKVMIHYIEMNLFDNYNWFIQIKDKTFVNFDNLKMVLRILTSDIDRILINSDRHFNSDD